MKNIQYLCCTAYHINYVVTPFKMIIELQKYIPNKKTDNEMQDLFYI